MNVNADFIFKGNAIFTACNGVPEQGFVAVKGNKIAAVDRLENFEQWVGPETEIIDCFDKMVIPGFFDSHVHLDLGVFASASVDLSTGTSAEDTAKILFENSAGKGIGKWITGFGWNHMYWESQTEPNKKILDRFFPDQPVFCMNDEVHGAWVNTKALELCDINCTTADPEGGAIVKDKNNAPSGFLLETAMNLVTDKLFSSVTPDFTSKGMQNLLNSIAGHGVTSVADLQIRKVDNEVFRTFESHDTLPVRIHLYPYLHSDENQEKQWEYVKSVHDRYKSEKLRVSGVKIFCDGTVLGHTGLMIKPYSDAPENNGMTLHDKSVTQANIIEAAKRGYSVRAHACGDGAVKFALDVFEKTTQVSGREKLRHAIEHIEVIDPVDLPRFKKLNVTASIQPEHMEIDPPAGLNPYDKIVGNDRKDRLWNFRSLLDSGARLAFGTDMPIVEINPFANIYRAVTRKDDDGYPANGWLPEERLTLAEALTAYTLDSAWLNFRDQDLGSLEAGKLADLVVLDRNLFEISESEISNTRAVITMMNGKIVYCSD